MGTGVVVNGQGLMSEIITYQKARIENAKATLGLKDVFLGDQQRIPRTPALAVEPGDMRDILDGAPRRVNRTFVFYLMVYHNKVQSEQITRLEAQLFAEQVQQFIHDDPWFGERPNHLVDHSLVTSNESGYASRSNSLLVTNRLTVEATRKIQLPV